VQALLLPEAVELGWRRVVHWLDRFIEITDQVMRCSLALTSEAALDPV